MQELLIAGSLAYDYILGYTGLLGDRLSQLRALDGCNITLQAHTMGRYYGGCGGNVAYTYALLGGTPRLLSIAGDDFEEYRQHLTRAGVNLEYVRTESDLHTATCVIITDDSQNRVVGFFGGATDRASELDLKGAIDERVGACLIVPDDSAAMLHFARSCREISLPFIFDFGSQASGLTGDQLLEGITGSELVICNEYELEVFAGKTGWDLERLLEAVPTVVYTCGDQGSVIQRRGQPACTIACCQLRRGAADSTGAGDAFRAGLVLGWMKDLPLETCAQLGATAAAFVLEAVGTQGHRFTLEDFRQRYQENFGEFPAALM